MIFTNARGFGKGFESEIDQCFKTANSVRIASGYASRDTVDNYRDDFIRIGKTGGKPLIVIANTTKGKGISLMENEASWHYWQPMDDATRAQIRSELMTAEKGPQ